MRQALRNGTVSVCLSRLSNVAAARGGFVAGCTAGKRSTDCCTAPCSNGAAAAVNASSVAFTAAVEGCLQCFDAVGWAAGRASGLYKTERWGAGVVICQERGAD